MTNLNNQFKSPTTKKYEAALDSLSDLKCGSSEYAAKQQEIETLLLTIEGEATRNQIRNEKANDKAEREHKNRLFLDQM